MGRNHEWIPFIFRECGCFFITSLKYSVNILIPYLIPCSTFLFRHSRLQLSLRDHNYSLHSLHYASHAFRNLEINPSTNQKSHCRSRHPNFSIFDRQLRGKIPQTMKSTFPEGIIPVAASPDRHDGIWGRKMGVLVHGLSEWKFDSMAEMAPCLANQPSRGHQPQRR